MFDICNHHMDSKKTLKNSNLPYYKQWSFLRTKGRKDMQLFTIRYKKSVGGISRQEEIELSKKQILLRSESKRHQGIVSKALKNKLEGHVKDISCVLYTQTQEAWGGRRTEWKYSRYHLCF